MKTVAALGSLVLVSWLVSCGRAPEAAAPAAPDAAPAPAAPGGGQLSREESETQEPATLAEAEALLERAKADLDGLALYDMGAASPAAAGAPAPEPAPPRATSSGEEKRAEKGAADQAQAEPKRDTSPCETACKAFSSLERASNAVCRLDSEPGAKRCERARQIREDAARRVTSCSCSK